MKLCFFCNCALSHLLFVIDLFLACSALDFHCVEFLVGPRNKIMKLEI